MTFNNTQKFLAGTIALVLVMGMTSPAFAVSIGGTDGETTLPVDTLTAPVVDCAVDTGEVIAWDTSKVATGTQYDTLMADLSGQGFTVREVNISTDGIPSCIVKLVVPSLGSNTCVTAQSRGAVEAPDEQRHPEAADPENDCAGQVPADVSSELRLGCGARHRAWAGSSRSQALFRSAWTGRRFEGTRR